VPDNVKRTPQQGVVFRSDNPLTPEELRGIAKTVRLIKDAIERLDEGPAEIGRK